MGFRLFCIVLDICTLLTFVCDLALTLEFGIILLYLRSLDKSGFDLLRYSMLANILNRSDLRLYHTFPFVRSVWQMIWSDLEASLLLLLT